MAENETSRGSRSETESSGFVVRQAAVKGQTDRRTSERDIGGFRVIEANDAAESGQDFEASTVGVEQPLPRQRRCSLCGLAGHTARNCTSSGVARTAPKAPTGQAISITAPLIVGTFNLMVIESMGEQCGITEKEAQFLIPSTQRTLERMPKGAAEKLAVVIDPAIIIAVMGMWLKRIGDIKRAEALQKYVVSPREQARADGVSGTEYRVDMPTPDAYVNGNGTVYADQTPPNMRGDINPPASGEIPIPEHPDYTANGVPSAIRDSFGAI